MFFHEGQDHLAAVGCVILGMEYCRQDTASTFRSAKEPEDLRSLLNP